MILYNTRIEKLHSDTSVTMEIYTHAFEESKNACADRFDEMMKKLENA